MSTVQTLLLLSAPLAAAVAIVVRRPERAVSLVDQADTWVVRRKQETVDAEDFFSRFVLRPLLWPFERIGNLTSDVTDPFLKTAIRVLAAGWTAAAVILAIDSLPFLFGGLIIMIAALAAIQHLLGGQGASKPAYTGRDPAAEPPPEPDPLDVEDGLSGDRAPR